MKSVRITIFLSLLLIGSFLALGGRCFYLQFSKNEHYIDLCLTQQRAYIGWQPQRGVILDCRGRVLAASNKIQTIFAEPRAIEDAKTTSTELASVVDMGAHEICKLILESRNPGFARIKIADDANQCTAASKIYGIGVQSDWQRHYPMGHLAANVVGFTSLDNRGLEGIELKYNKELSGSAAQNIFFADVRRRPIRLKQQSGILADGVGIILTLDATIQQIARDELVKQYEDFEAESAIAIVADPKTGAILAIVSIPDFDPRDRGSADPNSLRNRALTDPFEPGSMIKPIVVATALDNGTIRKGGKIFCENGNYSGKGFGRINEYRNHRFGNLSIREVLIKSSNIGMAKIGQKMGQQKLYNGLKLFGYGSPTGIELPGEVGGLLRPTDQWSSYSVTRIPYGYEINVTAMQMLQAYCILANGGRLVRPYLVKAIVDHNGDITELKQPLPPVGYIIKPEIARWIVTDCLVGVVNERDNGGTGWRAKLEKWQVFGKTGTANIAKVGEKGYADNSNLASFVAGAPAENPAIIVFVSIRRPNGSLGKGDSGGAVASPVAGRIIEKTLNYLGVKPTQQTSL
ncbi:MAG: peptidoglycan D,D-transpeptidase FtsI family protein [Planctomycetota bacterium]